jgi:uncharacterized protein YdbL (DUF1318 family)
MKQIFLVLLMVTVLATSMWSPSYAASYDLKEITPAVKVALENRRDRFETLSQMKRDGVIGENNKGYVDVVNDKGNAKTVVSDENRDRKVIYTAIAEQNGLTGAFQTIETVFAEVQHGKAAPGEYIQNASGAWVKK